MKIIMLIKWLILIHLVQLFDNSRSTIALAYPKMYLTFGGEQLTNWKREEPY